MPSARYLFIELRTETAISLKHRSSCRPCFYSESHAIVANFSQSIEFICVINSEKNLCSYEAVQTPWQRRCPSPNGGSNPRSTRFSLRSEQLWAFVDSRWPATSLSTQTSEFRRRTGQRECSTITRKGKRTRRTGFGNILRRRSHRSCPLSTSTFQAPSE